MFRGSVILFALAVNALTIWKALYLQTVPVETAAIRFLVALPICGVLLWLLRTAMASRPKSSRDSTGGSAAHGR